MTRTSLAVCAVILLAGCQSLPPGDAVPTNIPTYAVGDVITEELQGRLALRDECLVLAEKRSGEFLLLVWPSGSTFDGSSITISTSGEKVRQLSLGSNIRVEGSSQTWENLDHMAGIQHLRSACPFRVFFVVSGRPV